MPSNAIQAHQENNPVLTGVLRFPSGPDGAAILTGCLGRSRLLDLKLPPRLARLLLVLSGKKEDDAAWQTGLGRGWLGAEEVARRNFERSGYVLEKNSVVAYIWRLNDAVAAASRDLDVPLIIEQARGLGYRLSPSWHLEIVGDREFDSDRAFVDRTDRRGTGGTSKPERIRRSPN
jgi:hypothetical protein